MIVFCPNCGTQNPGAPGARATCSACNSVFDVPSDAPRGEPPPLVAAKPAERAAPPPRPDVFVSMAPPPPHPTGGTNTLAVVSLVAGLVCCIPYLSPIVAVACGVSAIRQLDASRDAQKGRSLAIAGIVLGALSGVFHVLSTLSTLFRKF